MKLLEVALLILFYFEFNFGVACKKKKTKSVTTLLDAKWGSTPLVLETAEYLADENSDFYWSFVDSISSLDPPLAAIENDKIRYETILKHASMLLTPLQLSMLKLGLSLHIYSPKVQMFTQIAEEKKLPDCSCVVYISGKLTCDLGEVDRLIENPVLNESIDLYHIDNHYPGSANRSLAVVLYGELGTTTFSKFHTLLKAKAVQGKIDYVIRHFFKDESNSKLRLSGYGVELQMKSTEYKAQDDTEVHQEQNSEEATQEEDDTELEGFDFAKLKKIFPDQKKNLDKLKRYLEESSNELAPLKVWQFQELSLQAAERIMTAPKEEALKVMTYIAQNFPIQAKGLVKTLVKPELKNEMKWNSEIFASNLNVQPSDTALFINGMFYEMDLVDVYGILEVLRQELRVMEGLHSIGIASKTLSKLLALDFADDRTHDFAIDIRDSAINWINDIENEPKYSRWASSLMELLRPTFPGMIRQIRRNLYNLVLLIDPLDPTVAPLLKFVESFVVHSAPIRIGLVFNVTDSQSLNGIDDPSVAVQCAYNYATQSRDGKAAIAFLRSIMRRADGRKVTVDDVKNEIRAEFGEDPNDILGEDSDYDFGRQLAADFIARTGLKTFPQALLNGIPLPQNQMNVDDFEEAVLQEVMSQTPSFQKNVYRGKLTDSDDVVDFMMNQPNVMPRLNERILNKEKSFYLDMTGKPTSLVDLQKLLHLSPRDMTATAVENIRYFVVPRKGVTRHSTTYWIVGDLKCKKSRNLLLEALEHLKTESDVRVTFIPNVNGGNNELNKIVLAALQELPSDKALNLVLSLLKDDSIPTKLEKGENIDLPTEVSLRLETQELNLKMLRVYCQRVLRLKESERAVIANGRVLGPLKEDEKFTNEDFGLLERFSSTLYLDKIKEVLANTSDDDEDISSNDLVKMVGLLVSRPQTKSRVDVPFAGDLHSVIKLPPAKPDSVAFDIVAIVDPVSRGAQKLGPILQILQEVLNCNIRVFLNSVEKNSDMPVKSFYRFVMEPEIQFTEGGKQLPGPIARFNNMPSSPLLTQNYHVPENWLVEVVRSVYDLDNIRLENVESNVHSEYELEYLLLEGHCFEQNTGSPPRGLQITLGTENTPVMVDTIVMANLGYFQLKANPGAWLLKLRQGRSAEIYDIVSHEGSDTPPNSTDIKVLISSFRSHVVKLRVQKKPDKMNVDLLADDDDDNSGIWNSITSSFTSNDDKQEEKLNIFSVASGHLYERFLKIMMLSVLKHTKTPVKFWFLKNYLSPQIKDFLPYMAKEYGFEYELVQYKWPRWLHQQSEKQRIIWGYKILFLDVLFPLDVKKIIFVDADQVVRADLKELYNLDLGGAPYGYTPFCESRKEMDGFRFWKHGYWKNHLQGRKYHISALYVVDLKRFRRIAAGDRLRGQYQALSQDPNSLSNLDQDLPNNMIHQVAIKSLPQEWLWCETWCDDVSKERAKTIDLCNNPMTKEAKLSAAMRILPEWKEYDDEIRRLQKKIDAGSFDSEEHHEQVDKAKADQHSEL